MCSEEYSDLVGQEMRCCLCGITERLEDPAGQLHPGQRARYGEGAKWYTNGFLRDDPGHTVLRFFVCPPCQGKGGKGLARAWQWARESFAKESQHEAAGAARMR